MRRWGWIGGNLLTFLPDRRRALGLHPNQRLEGIALPRQCQHASMLTYPDAKSSIASEMPNDGFGRTAAVVAPRSPLTRKGPVALARHRPQHSPILGRR